MEAAIPITEVRPGTPVVTESLRSFWPASKQIPSAAVLGTMTQPPDQLGFKVQVRYKARKLWHEQWLNLPATAMITPLNGSRGKLVNAIHNAQARHRFDEWLVESFLSVGTDPEIFVVDENEQVIPAWEFLPDKGKGNLFWDGFQAEFTPPGKTCISFLGDEIRNRLFDLLFRARKHNPKAKLTLRNTVEISKDVLKGLPLDKIRLGCDPSQNIYGATGLLCGDPRCMTIRSCGGHIHFGMYKPIQANIEQAVSCLDAVLAVACVSLFANIDDPRRRRFYGLAGEYRLPTHGLEYRSLSNGWLQHPAIMHLVFTLARQAVRMGFSNLRSAWRADDDAVQAVINNHDVDGARRMLATNRGILTKLLTNYYQRAHDFRTYSVEFIDPKSVVDDVVAITIETIMRGSEFAVENPQDIERNWNLDGSWQSQCFNKNCQWNDAAQSILLGQKV